MQFDIFHVIITIETVRIINKQTQANNLQMKKKEDIRNFLPYDLILPAINGYTAQSFFPPVVVSFLRFVYVLLVPRRRRENLTDRVEQWTLGVFLSGH